MSHALTRITSAAAVAAATLLAPATSSAQTAVPRAETTPPPTEAVEHFDEYHGTRVADPFRWLEDADSPETAAWVAAQNKVTFGYLESIPGREEIRRRLEQLWNYERFGLPEPKGGRYFYTHNDGLQNQAVLYVADDLELAGRRTLVDPNVLDAGGTTALTDWEASPDGRHVAYGLAGAGSDWNTWRVLRVDDGQNLEDTIEWVKFSGVSWLEDGSGFFYSRYDEPRGEAQFSGVNYYQKLYYHALGTPQGEDVLIYHRPDEKEWGFNGTVSDDGRWLVISVWKGTGENNLIYLAPLPGGKVAEATKEPFPLVGEFEASYVFLGNDAGGDDAGVDEGRPQQMYFLSDSQADTRRVVALRVDPAAKAVTGERTVVAARPETIEAASLLGDTLFLNYLVDATSRVERFSLQGEALGAVELPGQGTVAGFENDRDSGETFFSFTNYVTPPAIYRLAPPGGRPELWRRPEVAFDVADYETRQVFYESKDGTRIPMILSHKKGLEFDGAVPTILYGYGGFNISVTPRYSPANLVWMEMGGMYAVANLRGGGEYGKAWHEAGMFGRKQNVFDDFLAAAEYLIAEGYTSREKLAVSGRSNGGLLVGAAMTQRPELFAAALPAVGVMDMLRYHKFTIGWAWAEEYGSSDSAEHFPALRAYSPYHNLRDGVAYPATLVTTADHDDRVVPGHSFKFAARLQQAHAGDAPVLIRVETSAGHGAGMSTRKLIEQTADIYAFLVDNLGMEVALGE